MPFTLPLDSSLWARYQRLSQEFIVGIDKIVKNGETIVGGDFTKDKDISEVCVFSGSSHLCSRGIAM